MRFLPISRENILDGAEAAWDQWLAVGMVASSGRAVRKGLRRDRNGREGRREAYCLEAQDFAEVGMMKVFMVLGILAIQGAAAQQVQPGKMAKIGTVDVRFQSYNVEMV